MNGRIVLAFSLGALTLCAITTGALADLSNKERLDRCDNNKARLAELKRLLPGVAKGSPKAASMLQQIREHETNIVALRCSEKTVPVEPGVRASDAPSHMAIGAPEPLAKWQTPNDPGPFNGEWKGGDWGTVTLTGTIDKMTGTYAGAIAGRRSNGWIALTRGADGWYGGTWSDNDKTFKGELKVKRASRLHLDVRWTTNGAPSQGVSTWQK